MNLYPSLRNNIVLVTGGGSGIGAGLVKNFALQGAKVYYIDIIDQNNPQDFEGLDFAPIFCECDLTNDSALIETLNNIGSVDVLINNAASDDRHTLEEIDSNYFDNRIAVNLKHFFTCARFVSPLMKAKQSGVIINLGSISWHLGLEDLVLYETAKAGIEGMTRGLARELGPFGIRVVTIVPGNVKTPRQMKWYTPEQEAEIVKAQCLNGRIEPDDVAKLAMFLASDDARFCTGHEYWIDAGWR